MTFDDATVPPPNTTRPAKKSVEKPHVRFVGPLLPASAEKGGLPDATLRAIR